MKKRNAFKHKVLFLNVHYSNIKKHISSYLWQHNELSASIICSNNRYANQIGHTIECYKNFYTEKDWEIWGSGFMSPSFGRYGVGMCVLDTTIVILAV